MRRVDSRLVSFLFTISIVTGIIGPFLILGAMLHDHRVAAQDLLCLVRYEREQGLAAGGFHGDIPQCNLVEAKKLGYRSTRVWIEENASAELLLMKESPFGELADTRLIRIVVFAGVLALQAIISGCWVLYILNARRRNSID